jgi:hypothetical protein
MNCFTIPEQDIIDKKYNSPLDFIVDYIDMYTKQARVFYKVYAKDIQYYKIYEQSLLNYLIRKTGERSINLSDFIEVENLINEFLGRRFYDEVFIQCTILVYIKGVAILLDNVILEVNQYNYENIKCLYFYTNSNINLYNLFTKKAFKHIRMNKESLIVYNKSFWDILNEIIEDMDTINKIIENTEVSHIIGDPDLMKRVSVSTNILGDHRVEKYDKKRFFEVVLERLKYIIGDVSNDRKYVIITNLVSELILKGICKEEDLEEYIKYSKELIDKGICKELL